MDIVHQTVTKEIEDLKNKPRLFVTRIITLVKIMQKMKE